jgi:hypothetical protein
MPAVALVVANIPLGRKPRALACLSESGSSTRRLQEGFRLSFFEVLLDGARGCGLPRTTGQYCSVAMPTTRTLKKSSGGLAASALPTANALIATAACARFRRVARAAAACA